MPLSSRCNTQSSLRTANGATDSRRGHVCVASWRRTLHYETVAIWLICLQGCTTRAPQPTRAVLREQRLGRKGRDVDEGILQRSGRSDAAQHRHVSQGAALSLQSEPFPCPYQTLDRRNSSAASRRQITSRLRVPGHVGISKAICCAS